MIYVLVRNQETIVMMYSMDEMDAAGRRYEGFSVLEEVVELRNELL